MIGIDPGDNSTPNSAVHDAGGCGMTMFIGVAGLFPGMGTLE
jgi:hypothetical protein